MPVPGGSGLLIIPVFIVLAVTLVHAHPISSSQIDPLLDHVQENYVRTKRDGGGKGSSGEVTSDYVTGKSVVVMVKRKRNSSVRSPDETYRVTKRNKEHPYRKKVRPVEKPITPYFVRILRRRPVGPSAMNYTEKEETTFENSDNGEIIDVPRVLVDKRRNKNVDSIHPIYVVEDDDDLTKPTQNKTQNDSILFIPTSSQPTTTTTSTPAPPTIPIVRFTRVDQQNNASPDMDYENRGIEAVRNQKELDPLFVHGIEGLQKVEEENVTEPIVLPHEQIHTTTTGDPQEYDHVDEVDYDTNLTTVVPGDDTRDYLPLDYEYGNGTETTTVNYQEDQDIHQQEQTRHLVQFPDPHPPLPSPHSLVLEESLHSEPEQMIPSKKRVLQTPPETVVLTREPDNAVFGDYGYNGIVIGGQVSPGTGQNSSASSSTSSTSTSPTTTTSTTTTTTSTTTPPPTTPPPTTPSPTTSTPRPPPPPTENPQVQLLELLLSSPKPTQDDATTLAQLHLIAHLLTSTESPPLTTPRFTPFPSQEYSTADLQTSASTIPQFFSTRSDISTTKNPLLSLLDALGGGGNQQQQQRSASQQAQLTQSQEQVVSFVSPIQENKQSDNDIGGSLLRMLVQLPGNILVGVIRFMRSTGEFLGGLMNGVVKMISGLSGGSSGGLFGG